MPERYRCRACGEQIAAGHRACPMCGYNPRRTMVLASAALVLGGAVALPFVGDVGALVSLVGVVLFVWSAVWATPTR